MSQKYRCKHCGQIVSRKSEKTWIKSYCGIADRFVHLMRVKNEPL